MPWIVGIDEAGYGPNLGPFVMSSVACRVPECHRGANLWHVLRAAARRPEEPTCTRLVVGDSKLVYTSGKGLAELERTVLSGLASRALTSAEIVMLLGPECHGELQDEIWYMGDTPLPVDAEHHACADGAGTMARLCAALEIVWGPARSVIICPRAFNGMLDRWGSKGAVLAFAAVELLRRLPAGPDEVIICIDKHGGRNNYAATLQPAFPDDLVMAHEEGNDRSYYRTTDRGRQVEITFQPRADSEHFCVALASMVSKYLREVLMLEFNRFWQTHVPGLRPTAGYPGDSQRFWDAIEPITKRMRLPADTLWRRK
jgi:ribonuclease HII